MSKFQAALGILAIITVLVVPAYSEETTAAHPALNTPSTAENREPPQASPADTVQGTAAGAPRSALADRVSDNLLVATVKTELLANDALRGSHIEVVAQGGEVLLEGVVKSDVQRVSAEEPVRKVEGVRKVENRMVVGT